MISRSFNSAARHVAYSRIFLRLKLLPVLPDRKPYCQATIKILSEIKLKATCVQLRIIMGKINLPGEVSVDIRDISFQV